uniref:Aminopeptidase n=1 Tax=Trichuris muris TaxID=70415 RepID=A0A5S6QEP3_TRIMR
MLSDLPSIDIFEGRPDELPSRLPPRASPVGISSLTAHRPAAERKATLEIQDTYTISKKWAIILLTLIAVLLLLIFIIPVIVYHSRQCSYFAGGGFPIGSAQQSHRIPRTLLPTLYYIDLKVFLPSAGAVFDPRLSFRFNGKVAIVLTCTAQTRHVVVNSVDLKVGLGQAELQETDTKRAIGLTNLTYEASVQQLIYEAEQPMEVGKNYTFTLAYTGVAAKHPCSGVYRISYSESGQEKYFAAVQVGPAAARRWFPSMDEPDLKSIFAVTIEHPQSTKALSNGQEKSETALGDGWKKTTFSHTSRLAPHQLAFVVGHLAYKEVPKNRNGKLRLWLRPRHIEASHRPLRTISAALNALENYLEYDAIDAKLDVVAFPMYVAAQRSQAMNLIVLSELDILYGEKPGSGASIGKGTLNIVNALAQQWFGNLVTAKWWNSYWFGRSAAVFMQLMMANLVEPERESLEGDFITEMLQVALECDALAGSTPLSGNVKVPSEELHNFSPEQYKKGAAILRMIYHVVEDAIFKQVMSSYVRKHAHGNADHLDWLNALAEAASRISARPHQLTNNATTILRGWFEQPTYPLLTLVRQYEAGLATFKQAPISLIQQIDFGYRQWNVPVWYQQEPLSPPSKLWLRAGEEARVDVPKAPYNFVLATTGALGFYRVHYDEANWQLINMQLQVQHELVDSKSRAQLLDDAFNLARNGKMSYHLALDMTKYLPQEVDVSVWRVAARHIEHLHLMLSSTRHENDVNRFALNAYEAMYHRLGFEPTDNSGTKQGNLRALIWDGACKFSISHCVQTAKNLFAQFQRRCETGKTSGECNMIPVNLRPTVYCVSIAEAESSQQWSFLWKKYTEEDNINEQEALLRGLSCSKDVMLLNNLLDKALSDREVKLSFTPLIYRYISNHQTGRAMLWDYTTRNWDRITDSFKGAIELDYMVQYATKAFKTIRTLESLQAFLSSGKNLDSSKQAFLEQLQAVHEKIFWTEHYSGDVVRWIQNNVPGMYSIHRSRAK